jgi:hypothetical protein
MVTKAVIATIALLLATTGAAFAQSAYTSGTEASSAAAGYASPYAGVGIYAYVPRHERIYATHSRERRR